jgi:hypothetical protein
VTFQTPAALLLLAAVPLAALLLGRGLRRRTRRIAAFPLLVGLVDALPLLPRTHLLRRRLQVLLFLAAISCAAAAAGGPVLGAAGDPPRRAAILIDDLSLWRDEAGELTAWKSLLAEASRVARSFRGDDRILVVRTGAGLVGEGPLPPRRAAAFIRTLRPSLSAPDPGGAAGLLSALGDAHAAPLVRIVTPDPGRWTAAVAGRGVGWRVVGVPMPRGPGVNHAILDVELRPDFFTPGRVALFCRVGSFGAEKGGSANLTLRVSRDGVPLAERSFAPAPGETRAEVFPDLDAGAGVLRVEISPHDRFPDDDVYLAPLRSRPALPVELVTEGNAPLEAALRAVPGVDLALSRPPGGRDAAGKIRVFDRIPPAEEGRALLVIAPPQGMPGIAYRGDAVEPREIRAAGAGALLRGVATEHLRPRRLPILVLPDGVEAVLTADGHPLVAAGKTPGGSRLALVAFDPAESGWTRDPSYPILIANLLAWLAEDAASTRSSLLVGENLPADLAPTVRRLIDPMGTAAAEPPGGWKDFRFPMPGAWRVEGAGTGAAGELFVNLLDELVSAAMAPPPEPNAGAHPEEAPRPFRADGRQALLAAAIALLVLERLVAARRPSGRLP